MGYPSVRFAKALEASGFVGVWVVVFLLMVYIVVGFEWVISVVIALWVHPWKIEGVVRVQLALANRCVEMEVGQVFGGRGGSERGWCSSGVVGLGRYFLLGWFVMVSRAAWLFWGDGVLVISACGLLLVVGFEPCGFDACSGWVGWRCGSCISSGATLCCLISGGRWRGTQSSPNSRWCRWRCNFGGGWGMSGCCLSCTSGSGGGIKVLKKW